MGLNIPLPQTSIALIHIVVEQVGLWENGRG